MRLKSHLIHYQFVHLENNNCLTFRDYIKRLVIVFFFFLVFRFLLDAILTRSRSQCHIFEFGWANCYKLSFADQHMGLLLGFGLDSLGLAREGTER